VDEDMQVAQYDEVKYETGLEDMQMMWSYMLSDGLGIGRSKLRGRSSASLEFRKNTLDFSR
jgi:hypothetical protein